MEINRDNYEAYLLDLIEGRLSAGDRQKVRDFLALNPDCAIGLDQIEPWILEKSNIHLPGKEQLKKTLPDASFTVTEGNFDLFSIARLEGDLTEAQTSDHAGMVAQSDKKEREWEEWKQTKLKAESVIFAHKEELKRNRGIRPGLIWISIISAAAVFALLFTILRNDPFAPGPQFATESGRALSDPEDPVLAEGTDPDPPEQLVVILPEEKPGKVEDKPALFSIKKNSERPEESPVEKGGRVIDPESDSIKEIHAPQIQPERIRIASASGDYPDFLYRGSYDGIKPLDIPPASIHITSLSIAQIAEVDLQEVFDAYTEENNISLWSIANAGIKGINRLTGSDMSLLAARDEDGDLSGIRFKSRRFSFTRPIDR